MKQECPRKSRLTGEQVSSDGSFRFVHYSSKVGSGLKGPRTPFMDSFRVADRPEVGWGTQYKSVYKSESRREREKCVSLDHSASRFGILMWRTYFMPRIATRYLRTVVYIYRDQESAKADAIGGGTGFFVGRLVDGGYQTFVVTNRHVIEKMANPVIRLNRSSGEPALFATNRARWKDHPEGDDVSVYQLDMSEKEHRHVFFWESAFLGSNNDYIGLGSDVAMLGRFVGLNGQVEVSPTARFGSIASPDLVREANSFKHPQQTIVVECHSVPGFSGSPVIAYLPSTALTETSLENSGVGPYLLGVIWKHFGSPEEVLDEGGKEIGAYVKGNSGLAGVIPAWRISDVLTIFAPSISGTFEKTEEKQEPANDAIRPGES